MTLKDSKYDGKGGLWKQHHPKIAAQGNIQIGGRVIGLTVWLNDKGGTAPEYTISVNEQKTKPEDLAWFKALSPPPKIVGRKADILIADDIAAEAARVFRSVDDDIPF